MRIASSNTYDATVDTLVKRQAELSDMQQKLSSTLRVSKSSDDPTAAARAERALASSDRTEASQRALDSSKTAMTLTESSIGDAEDLLGRARELMVQAGNGSYSDTERKSLADELSGIRGDLLNIANRDDGNGQYLFGGQGSASAPFVDTTSGVQYRGTTGDAQVASGESLPRSVDGAATWMQGPSGNGVFETSAVTSTGQAWIDSGRVTDPSLLTGGTYTVQFDNSSGTMQYSVLNNGQPTALTGVTYSDGSAIEIDGMSFTIKGAPASGDTFQVAPSTSNLSVFGVLDQTIADLRKSQPNSGQLQQMSSTRISQIDSVLGRLQAVRSQVGGTLNRIDSVSSRLDDSKLASDTVRTKATQLDMVSAISDFQNQQTSYDAALKSYASVQKLSLFNYIN